MPLIALGINHRTAPVELRERVVFAPERMQDALRELTGLPGIQEAAILSTCNRTELYVGSEEDASGTVIHWLSRFHHLDEGTLRPYLYHLQDADTVRHILRVASGLDSMILGEPQILGQMKCAYQCAAQAGCVDSLLSRLFQHAFSVAKQVRTDTAIGASPVSVAFAAVSLARQIFGDLAQQTALLIGAGETVELAARHLHEHGLGRMIVANRTVEHAHTLASLFNGYGIGLEEIPAHLAEADIVISSTASSTPILTLPAVKQALKARKHRPIFMVDIAVPRDIEPRIGELDDIFLYTVDNLQEVIQENLKSRQAAARQAEEMIDVQVNHFIAWQRSRDAVPAIRQLREQAESQRDEVLQKARQQLASGKDPVQVMEYLAHTLTNKLIHQPSTHLRQAGSDGRTDLLEAARELLNLPESE
ncbi:MAG: glutamyl-tRNA reductase [Gammaproteobacteria bacterium]|nr:glutamyl-tRNA reductase [Gammaproteobacteria bacterium]